MWGIAAGRACQYRILPGNGNGVERKILACWTFAIPPFFPSATPYHQPLLVTDLERIPIPDCVET